MEHSAYAHSLDHILHSIEKLDLEPMKFRLTHEKTENPWSRERAELAALGYRRYLVLQAKYPGKIIPPTEDIDTFWHAHILDTRKYAEDCQNVFGCLLHHFPYSGLRGDEDLSRHEAAASDMKALYEREFGEPLSLLGAWWTHESAGSQPELKSASCTRVAASWHAGEESVAPARAQAADAAVEAAVARPRASERERRKATSAAWCG
ncbi:glycine-rich domain-containing protein [Eleftheria terrae]|uniref:glycine-rich domain-containing protein n=1 Tax=Eleftheria terrae TaxID=1597781 RepID=UPI00263A8BC6|nr:glycine-rich domain-containing protein-like [Eleftheria terrae]WKB51310.1 glycine-rich domain-containing protein-like [Eleftheria terrae]